MIIRTAEIAVDAYISQYRDKARFEKACKACGNYMKLWTCPPFAFDAEGRLSLWTRAFFVAVTINVPPEKRKLKYAHELLTPVRRKLESQLLELEKMHGGLAFGFSGSCIHCEHCARLDGKECLHPEKVRPALEAYGFDVSRTMSEVLDIELQWGENGELPPTITLVGALFHNHQENVVSFPI